MQTVSFGRGRYSIASSEGRLQLPVSGINRAVELSVSVDLRISYLAVLKKLESCAPKQLIPSIAMVHKTPVLNMVAQ